MRRTWSANRASDQQLTKSVCGNTEASPAVGVVRGRLLNALASSANVLLFTDGVSRTKLPGAWQQLRTDESRLRKATRKVRALVQANTPPPPPDAAKLVGLQY